MWQLRWKRVQKTGNFLQRNGNRGKLIGNTDRGGFGVELDYNIVLIGFMGAGKSTVAGYLKEAYGMEVVEMDQVIAQKEGMSIPDIFTVKGEAYFRNLETGLLKELQTRRNTVISCGGGAAMREENVREMKKNGKVVLLTVTPETAYERVKNSEERPVLKGNKRVSYIAGLMEERRQKYEAAADLAVSTDGRTVREIGEEIIRKVMELDKKDV